MGVKINISTWRQLAIAISRKYCQENPFQEGSAEEEGEEEEDEEDNPWDLQTGHSSHIGGMIYARLLEEGDSSVASQREKFHAISQQWHRFLEFPSSYQGIGLNRQKRKSVSNDLEDVRIKRWKRTRNIDIHERLESMMGSKVRSRGLQEPILRAIIRNHSSILAIMATGGGKSLLFMLPAYSISGGTTIIITPLVSLQEDLCVRCQKVGIPSTMWNLQSRPHGERIVITTPESAVSQGFMTFLNQLQGACQLDRIVIDECHTILDATDTFRTRMRELGELGKLGVQMLFLTATLPPSVEEEFFQMIKIRMPTADIFRDRTQRKNIAYSVHEYGK
jgi:superfamily II DNA helicase RecQ